LGTDARRDYARAGAWQLMEKSISLPFAKSV
jgi:hypothetical protein